jgi:bifunctional non-homologous end joining protein LigD
MLAATRQIGDDNAFGIEPKLDGWRAIVHVDRARVRVFTRPGREIALSLPELAPLVDVVPPGTVLDGELVAGSGRAWSFYRLGPLVASNPARRRSPLAFAAFDLLASGTTRVMDLPYEERRALLEGLAFAGPAWCTVPSWRGISVADALLACEGQGVEGLVAKRLDGRYFAGERRTEWAKVKTAHWRSTHADRRHDSGPKVPDPR